MLLIGCGAIALLGLLATVVGGFGLYRAYMENTTEDERASFREGRALMQDLTEASRRDSASASARNRFSFEAPANGRLDASHVRRYSAIQERVWSEMEEPYRAFDERWRALLRDGAESDRGAGARFVMERGRLEVRRVEALREAQVAERMSDEEYNWIEGRILPAWAAITVERTEGRDLTDREQAEASWAAIMGMQAHDRDIELLRPHYDTMRAVPMQLFLLGLLPE